MHPERPERLRSIVAKLKREGLWEQLLLVSSGPEPTEWIEEVHAGEYVRRVERACREGWPYIDVGDSAICGESYAVAREAVAVTLGACDTIMAGEAANGFCALRPPGHHAERDRSMGFCLFNNVAVASRYLQKRHGLRRILILDWDVHHGNGTQHSFERDDTVYYCSLHQDPDTLYPGTGRASERGVGAGEGYTLNLPMRPGAGDDECLELFNERFLPAGRAFGPDFVLISAGFDGHRDDPLALLNLSEKAYNVMTRELKALAGQCCQGRLLSVLEGGYDLTALGRCVANHMKELT